MEWSEWVDLLSPALDSRTAWRLPIVLAGLLLARGNGSPRMPHFQTYTPIAQ